MATCLASATEVIVACLPTWVLPLLQLTSEAASPAASMRAAHWLLLEDIRAAAVAVLRLCAVPTTRRWWATCARLVRPREQAPHEDIHALLAAVGGDRDTLLAAVGGFSDAKLSKLISARIQQADAEVRA